MKIENVLGIFQRCFSQVLLIDLCTAYPNAPEKHKVQSLLEVWNKTALFFIGSRKVPVDSHCSQK